MKRVLVLFGTRPEVIKLAPVIRALRRRPKDFECLVVSSGQHREMVDQALAAFDLKVDVQLDAMSSAQSLGKLTSRLFLDLDTLFESNAIDWVIVQGDTTTAMVGAMCAFYRRIKVGHVEAGLRTYNRWSPFPEETNRTIISQIADLHFAPTSRSADNLVKAGFAATDVRITGNTVVDALVWVSENVRERIPAELDPSLIRSLEGRRLILVTSHRRESFGEGLENICQAILEIVRRYPDTVVVYPVHLNPNVREPVHRLLGGEPRISLLPPLGYLPLVYLMQRSYCILTDSGGIQEEAPSLGKPVLIMRDTTERPEVIEAGCARLVGTSKEGIVNAAEELLTNDVVYRAMAAVKNPFGDGSAAEIISDAINVYPR